MLVLAALITATACGTGEKEGASQPTARADIWAAQAGSDELLRLRADGSVRARIELCCRVRNIVVDGGRVWAATDREQVVRVDGRRNEVVAEIDVGGEVGAVAVADDAVFVSRDLTDVVRISTTTNEIVARTPVGAAGAPVVDIEVGNGSIWVLLDFRLELVRLDGKTGEIVGRRRLCPVGACRVGAAATTAGVAGGKVWVVDSTANQLLSIDARNLEVLARERLTPGLWNVAAGRDGVFLLDGRSGRLERVDPDDPASRELVGTFDQPKALALGEGSVWVAEATNLIARVDADSLEITDRVRAPSVRTMAVG
jgi:hypothetical protein